MANNQEASSSNSRESNSTRNWEYDVFLSFRGDDTRRGFTDHLYHALKRSGLRVFRDDNELRRGEVISDELLLAIEKSRFAIVVLSPNYASSSWCLDELQHILKSRNELHRQVFPIFYHVDPSDVRRQTGSVGSAFTGLAMRFRKQPDKVQKWRNSLAGVAGMSGWHCSKDVYESPLVERVAGYLWDQLQPELPSSRDTVLIGIDWRIHEIESHLSRRTKLDDVQFIGIWGMGGVGKTTLARAIFERFQSQFDFHCFLANVRHVSETDGLDLLQRKLLSQLKVKNIDIEDTHDGRNKVRSHLKNKNVMLILDDISSKSQLENLAGSAEWFGNGSRIIITTTDSHLLRSHNVNETYEVKPMNDHESLELFCQIAFQRPEPREGFLDVAIAVVNYARGLPLALCVLGSFFIGRDDITQWEDALDMLREDLIDDIFKILRISYDALSNAEQTIFLDIACFFNMWGRDEITKILESCGLRAKTGMRTLMEKSLIAEIEIGNNKYIEMHNLVQEMGRHIVIKASPDNIGRRSRLWLPEDIDQVLKRNLGTEATRGVVLPFSFGKDRVNWNPEAFLSMHRLQLLIISCNFELHGFNGFPWTLKVLHWYGYPLEALPLEEDLEKLVYLKMHNSRIERLLLDHQFGRYGERRSHGFNVKTFSATMPGKEIPSCFENQESLSPDKGYESSILIDVPTPGDSWLGFVLCVVLEDDMFYSTQAYQNMFCWRYYLKASDGNFVFLQARGRKLEKEINSPHLWILFGQIKKKDGLGSLAMQFSQLLLKFEAEKNGKLNFIKCGWRFISKIDLASLVPEIQAAQYSASHPQQNSIKCPFRHRMNRLVVSSELNEGGMEVGNVSNLMAEMVINNDFNPTMDFNALNNLEFRMPVFSSTWCNLPFNTDNASHCDLLNPSMATSPSAIQSPFTSSFRASVSVITQESKIPTDDSIDDTRVPVSEQTTAKEISEELSKISDLEVTEWLQIYDMMKESIRHLRLFHALN